MNVHKTILLCFVYEAVTKAHALPGFSVNNVKNL